MKKKKTSFSAEQSEKYELIMPCYVEKQSVYDT